MDVTSTCIKAFDIPHWALPGKVMQLPSICMGCKCTLRVSCTLTAQQRPHHASWSVHLRLHCLLDDDTLFGLALMFCVQPPRVHCFDRLSVSRSRSTYTT